MTYPPLGDMLAALRESTPLVHCMTNYVAMNSTANLLLATGASPAMLHAAEEVAEFTTMADALSINIGTLSAPWAESMQLAARTTRPTPPGCWTPSPSGPPSSASGCARRCCPIAPASFAPMPRK